MSSVVKAQSAFLELLATSSKQQATALIKSMNKDQIKTICELLINVRYGNIPLTNKDKKKLSRKRNIIRELTSKTTTQKVRKQVIEREANLVIVIIKVILPHIKSLV